MNEPINKSENILSYMKKVHAEIIGGNDAPAMAYTTGKLLNEMRNTK